ncbi:MAG: hypothetical protein MRY83_24615, partial [Flavobacteriales bacterium]|nr:hypothetical protein [Flavobacteriales bacterium]
VRVLKEDKNQLRSYLLLKQARLYLCCDLSETMLQRWNKRVKDWVALAIQLDSEARYVWSEIFDELDWEERQEDMKLFTAQVDVEN